MLGRNISLTILLLMAGMLYVPGLTGPFLFDDGPALTGNPHMTFDAHLADEWRTASFSSSSGPLRRPLSMLTFAANYAVSGQVEPMGIKAVNVIIHLGCGVLVYLLAIGIFRHCLSKESDKTCHFLALFAAALWLMSPIHVSTVLYAVQRMAQLATFFVLLGLVIFTFARAKWALRGATVDEVIAVFLWLLICLVFAVFSKENGILLLWLVVVLEITLFRGRWDGIDNVCLQRLGYFAFFLPLLIALLIALSAPELFGRGYDAREFSMKERLFTQLRMLWQYLAWLTLPDINTMGFQHDDIQLSSSWLSPISTVISAIAWAGLLLLALVFNRRIPLLSMAVLFYLIGHSLESSVWPLEMVYEHRNYLPSVGVYVAVSWAIWTVSEKLPVARAQVFAGLIICAFGVALFLRAFAWGDSLRLHSVNVANHPDSSRSHYFLAETALRLHADYGEKYQDDQLRDNYLLMARQHFELMHRADPENLAALVMLYYMDQRHFPQLQAQIDWYKSILSATSNRTLQPSDYNALNALVDCFSSGVCGDKVRLERLLDQLELRYPKDLAIKTMRYRYLQISGAAVPTQIALLEKMQFSFPNALQVYQLQIEAYFNQGNLVGVLNAGQSMLMHDPRRYQLSVIKQVFGEASPDKSAH